MTLARKHRLVEAGFDMSQVCAVGMILKLVLFVFVILDLSIIQTAYQKF